MLDRNVLPIDGAVSVPDFCRAMFAAPRTVCVSEGVRLRAVAVSMPNAGWATFASRLDQTLAPPGSPRHVLAGDVALADDWIASEAFDDWEALPQFLFAWRRTLE